MPNKGLGGAAQRRALSFSRVSGSIPRAGPKNVMNQRRFLRLGEVLEASSAVEIAKHTLLSGGLILGIGTLTGFLAQKV